MSDSTTFTIKFSCDSEAFADNREEEIARILREVGDFVESGYTGRKVIDRMGNVVGQFAIDSPE